MLHGYQNNSFLFEAHALTWRFTITAARSKLKPPSSEALNLPLEAGQPEEAATERTKDKQGAQPSSGGHLAEESREVGATLNQQVPLQDGGARQGDNSSAVQVSDHRCDLIHIFRPQNMDVW